MPEQPEYHADPQVLRTAWAAFEHGRDRGLEPQQVVAVIADAVWGAAMELAQQAAQKALEGALEPAYNEGVAEGLRQATEGWEREWGTQWATDADLGTYPCDDEAEARAHVEKYPGNRVVSHLVGPWEPAEQPAPEEAAR